MNLDTLIRILPIIQQNFASRLPGWKFQVRARFLQENVAGNAIVFVPLGDNFEPGRQQPGVRRVTRVRVARVQAYIWGVTTKADGTIYKRGEAIPTDPDTKLPLDGRYSVGQVEAAINALACALEDSVKSVQYDLESGEWLDQEGEGVSEYGAGYMLTFSLRIPIVYDPAQGATVTAYQPGYIESDGTTVTVPPPREESHVIELEKKTEQKDAPTLDSIHADHVAQKKELNVEGIKKPVLVEPWHLAAIKAKHKIPGNREMTEEQFQELVSDIVQSTVIGGKPFEKKDTK